MVCGDVLSGRLPILTQYHCGPVNEGFGLGREISRTIYGHMDSDHATYDQLYDTLVGEIKLYGTHAGLRCPSHI